MTADEEQASTSDTPLLSAVPNQAHRPTFDKHANGDSSPRQTLHELRIGIRNFLASKYGHYTIFLLVSLDVAGIFADFIISLHVCEHAREEGIARWKQVAAALGVYSLIFSCLFMVELLLSIFAFGPAYFRSKFHCFDATAIVASFLVDVLTRGPVEEAGSLIIILRLFRVFKIVEESGTVATEQIGGYEEEIKGLREENEGLRKRVSAMQRVRMDDRVA